MHKDIPRCASGDFQQAPFYKTVFGDIPQEPKKIISCLKDGPAEGQVSCFYNHVKKYGFITVGSDDNLVFFHQSRVDTSYRKTIRPGDKVEFELHESTKGWEARKIRLIRPANRVFGVVKSYEVDGYGFIEVDDGGPDATFLYQALCATAQPFIAIDKRLSFYLNTTPVGRQAVDILILSNDTTAAMK